MVSKFSNKITILVTEQPADFTILVAKKVLQTILSKQYKN